MLKYAGELLCFMHCEISTIHMPGSVNQLAEFRDILLRNSNCKFVCVNDQAQHYQYWAHHQFLPLVHGKRALIECGVWFIHHNTDCFDER